MKIKILFITILLIVLFVSYLLISKNQQEKNDFIPPPAFSVLRELSPMTSSTSTVSTKETLYMNNTLGLSIIFPSTINLNKEVTELHKYELGSGEDKLGQAYKYYAIDFSDSNKEESSTYIRVTVKEVPYKTITEWLEEDKTHGGNFPEDTVKFAQKNMFGEDVLFGFDEWYKNYSTVEDGRSSEYVYVIKNGFLYKIELHNFSVEDREMIWRNIKLTNI